MKKLPVLIALFALAATPAFAEAVAQVGPEKFTIPVGEWIANFLLASMGTLTTVLTYVVQKYGSTILQRYLTHDVIEKSVNYAVMAIVDVGHGKTHDIETSNKLIAYAVKAAIAQEPRIVKWAGDNLATYVATNLTTRGLIEPGAHAAVLSGVKDYHELVPPKKVV